MINCSTCFNKKHYPESSILYICEKCKERNMIFYRPDFSDVKGYVTVVKENKE